MSLEKLNGKMFSMEDLAKINGLLIDGDISGWFGNHTGGPYLRQFEEAVAEVCGTKHAIAVSSGSASIYIALRALGIGPGDRVAVPAYTHVGSVAPIMLCGAEPCFIDVDFTGNINPSDNTLKLFKTRLNAIIAVHQLGLPCNMGRLRSEMGDIPIVEDASHAMSASYQGRQVGGLGELGCFSVGGGRTKIVGTGEGGVIATDSNGLADRCRNLRNHGDRVSGANYLCFNFRMSEINALLGLIQMRRLRELVDWQIRNAEYLINRLPQELLDYPLIDDPSDSCSDYKSVRYLVGCTLRVEAGLSRDEFLTKVKEKGFMGGVPRRNVSGGYSKLVSDMVLYQKYSRSLPKSDYLRDYSVWIDWHRYPRTCEDIDALLGCFKEILEEKKE